MRTPVFRIGFLCFAAVLPLIVGAARSDLDDLQGLVVANAKIPIYNKTRLQLICFADGARRSDNGIVGSNAVMEIIRRAADPDSIADGWGTKPYPLKAELPEVVNFWRKRYLYSEGVILGDRSTIDQTGKRASGSSPVFFRSPMLDLDGIGFEADFVRRTVLVASDVHVVLRHGASDLRKILGGSAKIPKKYERLFAESDSLLIDMTKREIVLIGNVVVVEEKARLSCDRLTIFLTGDGDPIGKTPEGERELGDVSRILASGNVVLVQTENTAKGSPGTRAEAEQMICDILNDTVELSGEEELPHIVSANGEKISGRVIRFSRGKLQATVIGSCRISTADGARLSADRGFFDAKNNYNDLVGGVKMENGGNTLLCRRMRVIMKPDGRKNPPPKPDPESTSATLLGAEQFAAAGGGRTLDRALFYEDVVLDDREGKLFCDEMHAKFLPGSDKENGVQLESAECFRRVRTVSKKTGARGEIPELKAEYARLNYAGNTLLFRKNVVMISGPSHLTCDMLDLFLTDRAAPPAEKNEAAAKSPRNDAASSPIARFSGSGKALTRAVARGAVQMRDAQGDLNADSVTLHFVEAKPGEPTEGTLQSGGMKLSLAECDGNVVAVSRPAKTGNSAAKKQKGAKREDSANPFGALASEHSERTLKAQHGRIDLLANTSEFHDSVEVTTSDSWLKCRDLYLYGSRTSAPEAPGSRKVEPKVADNPDDDPYETLPAATVAPARIVAGNGLELKRIRCEHDVVLCRRDPATKEEQRAGGDTGEYVVSTQQAVISSKPPRRSWLQSPGMRQECEKIVCDLKSGVFRTVNVFETLRTGKSAPGAGFRF